MLLTSQGVCKQGNPLLLEFIDISNSFPRKCGVTGTKTAGNGCGIACGIS